MIEVKDQRTLEQQVEDNLLSVESSLATTSDMVSDVENFKKIMKIIDDVKELRKSIKENGGK